MRNWGLRPFDSRNKLLDFSHLTVTLIFECIQRNVRNLSNWTNCADKIVKLTSVEKKKCFWNKKNALMASILLYFVNWARVLTVAHLFDDIFGGMTHVSLGSSQLKFSFFLLCKSDLVDSHKSDENAFK